MHKTGALLRQGTAGRADVTARDLTLVASLPYVRVHQFGYGVIPARPYMAPRAANLDRAGEIIGEHGLKVLEGR